MSAKQSSVLFNKVRPNKETWRVHVKCLHSWKINNNFGESAEFVLADQNGEKLHATARRSQMYRAQRNLPIGEWRFIQNFTVTAAGGQYRTTTSPYKINIIADTVYAKSDYHDDNLCIELKSFDYFGEPELKLYFLIDIIGEVFELGRVQTVQVHGADKKRLQFRMRDTTGLDVACCLWGKYAEQFEPFIEAENDQMLICLIRFAKIQLFRGTIQLTNAYDGSVVTLNPTVKEAIEFKQKMQQDDMSLALYDNKNNNKLIKKQVEDWTQIEVKSISEVLDSFEAGSCKIICSIESVDTDWGWFYFGCNICNKRVTRIGRDLVGTEKPMFRCEVCRANVRDVSPKYKLHLFVKDDSETCKIMLLDTVSSTIVGVEAAELWDGTYDEIEDPELLPQAVMDICGKSFCFGLTVKADNITNGADTYFVSEVWTNNHTYQLEAAPEPVSQIEGNSSTQSGGEVSLVNPNSQTTSDCVSTPFSKRKEEDADLKDMSSTSKKVCTKSIKLEKTKSD